MAWTGLLALLGFLVVAGVTVAMALGLRRRSPNHPACGRCGYDVTATVGHSDRCPECGALFVEVGIVPPTSRAGAASRATNKLVVVVLVVAAFLGGLLAVGGVFAARASVAKARAQAAAAQQQQAALARAAKQAAEDADNLKNESAVSEPTPEPRGEAP